MDRETFFDLSKSIKDLMIQKYKDDGNKLETRRADDGKIYVEAGFVNMVLDELEVARKFCKKCFALKEWNELDERLLDK